MLPENINVFFQRPPINRSMTKLKLCNITHKAPCRQALENIPTTHPKLIAKKAPTLIHVHKERYYFWFLSLRYAHSVCEFPGSIHYMERLWPYLLPGRLPSV